MQCVKPPRLCPALARRGSAAALAVAALLAAALPRPAAARDTAHFTEWFQSLAGSAQALADGDDAAAASLARAAVAARPLGPATQRARLALGLALLRAGQREEGAKLVDGSGNAIDPRITAQVRGAFAPLATAPRPAPSPLPPAPATAAPATATAEDQLREAERLVLDARPRHALTALDAAGLTSLTGEQRDRSDLLRALVYLQIGRRDEAESLARDLFARPAADPGTRLGAELVMARIAARAGRFADAIARYDAISTRPPAAIPGIAPAVARELAGEAAYLAAWLPFDAGQWSRAAEDLLRFASERPRSPRAVDARWFAAWALFRQGRVSDARSAWSSLERTALAPAALYWQARVSPPARARPLYRKAIDAESGGWYAFLAAGRLAALGTRISALPRGAPAPLLEEAPAAAESMARATALLELGLRDAAVAQLRGVSSGAANRASAAHVAQLAEAAGEAELTFRVARDLLPLSRRALRWQHPLAYGAGLDAIAESAHADPLLFRALMRRESTFRRDVRSPAGAEGLVQLMPYTAERLGVVLGAPAGEHPDLSDPSTSLPLGAAYLGLLTDRFAEPAAVLAAYNAGPAPIAAWVAANAGRPLDECVEELPYRETRHYVKLVMAAYATYRHLYAGAPARLDGARPLQKAREGVGF
jgi:soluble lytic murein transglycosylase